MGWGCYKHECDMDSPSAVRKLNILCEKRLKRDEKDWGRDGSICPYCWEELEQERDRLRKLVDSENIRELLGYIEDHGDARAWDMAQAWMQERADATMDPDGR